MYKLLTAVALFISTTASAGTLLDVHLASHHTAERSKTNSVNYNEQNLGVGFTYRWLSAGTYKNSYDRRSYYLGYTGGVGWLSNRHWATSYTVGAVSGYGLSEESPGKYPNSDVDRPSEYEACTVYRDEDKCVKEGTILPLLAVQVRHRDTGLRVGLTPQGQDGAVVTFGWSYEIN